MAENWGMQRGASAPGTEHWFELQWHSRSVTSLRARQYRQLNIEQSGRDLILLNVSRSDEPRPERGGPGQRCIPEHSTKPGGTCNALLE